MRQLTTIAFTLLSSLLWAQSKVPAWGLERLKPFQDRYSISKYIQPPYLEGDFSGDKINDIALLIERKIDKKKGIIIFIAQSQKTFVVGAGNKFSTIGDNFDWAEKWNIFTEKTTYETTFKENGDVDGENEIKLDKVAITIGEKGGSNGLIYFDGQEFTWIPQGD